MIQKKDYDPFGNAVLVENFTTTATTLAKLPLYGFSTKPQDGATGLYYYSYRHYDPITGRWLSRDSISEAGGDNLYAFLNNTVFGCDYLGQSIQKYGTDVNTLPLEAGQVPADAVGSEDGTWKYSGKCELTSAAFWGSGLFGDNEELTLEGDLSIKLTKKAGVDENDSSVVKGHASGTTVAQHERHHAQIDKDNFNSSAKYSNKHEGKYCPPLL